ncbi:hypothetical protein ACWGH5_16115 [Streptomyces sp. NPDC054864]
MTRAGKAHYYLTDALGSVVATADETGAKVNAYCYSPRGVSRSASSEKVGQLHRFADGYQDVTGLEGDPVNRVDPSGLFRFKDLGIATLIGAAAGATTGCDEGAVTAAIVGSAAGPGGTTVGALGGMRHRSSRGRIRWRGWRSCDIAPEPAPQAVAELKEEA